MLAWLIVLEASRIRAQIFDNIDECDIGLYFYFLFFDMST